MRGGQNRQRRGGRGGRRFNDRRGGRRFNDRRRRDSQDQPRRFRRGSRDFTRRSDRAPQSDRRDRDESRRSGDRTRRISKDDRRRIPRGTKRDNDPKPNRDLDSQLMNYWVKSGRKTDQEGKNLAQLKLNQDLDNYWKQKDQNAQKVQQKKKQ